MASKGVIMRVVRCAWRCALHVGCCGPCEKRVMRAAQQASNPLRTSYMTTPWGWIVGSCHRKSRGEKQRAESGDEKKPSPQASSLSVSPWSSSRNTRALLCSHLPPVALRSSPAPSPARDSLNTQLSLEHDAAWLPRPSYTNLRAISLQARPHDCQRPPIVDPNALPRLLSCRVIFPPRICFN